MEEGLEGINGDGKNQIKSNQFILYCVDKVVYTGLGQITEDLEANQRCLHCILESVRIAKCF